MSEEYVSRTEFNQLKDKVDKIEEQSAENSKLLTIIDKKIDVIDAKMITAKEIDDLKLAPLEKRIETLEEAKKKIWTAIITSIISIVVGAVVYVVKMMP